MRYIGLVFFVFSTAIVYSQDYSNLIENGKYSKVLKKSLKVLKKTPNSIEDLYFASVVTSRVGAGNLYSPKQAYDYYIKAKVEYVKETDDKKLLKLDKLTIGANEFKVALSLLSNRRKTNKREKDTNTKGNQKRDNDAFWCNENRNFSIDKY